MAVSSVLTDQEASKFCEEMYSYFDTGYDFEEFLKEYLIKIGLDEVQVTQRSRDGGIDLIAVRKGVGDFSEIDTTRYYIQAKRHTSKNKISVHKIRELKGVLPAGYRGMFITTSDFTADAVEAAESDPARPIVLVNGKRLVTSCIDKGIGFLFKPSFSKEQMDSFINRGKKAEKQEVNDKDIDYIEKTITYNDVRSRIISIPSSIMKQFNDTMIQAEVEVNGNTKYSLSINRDRKYFGGVTQLFRQFGLLSGDGVITEKQSKWSYDANVQLVKIIIED